MHSQRTLSFVESHFIGVDANKRSVEKKRLGVFSPFLLVPGKNDLSFCQEREGDKRTKWERQKNKSPDWWLIKPRPMLWSANLYYPKTSSHSKRALINLMKRSSSEWHLVAQFFISSIATSAPLRGSIAKKWRIRNVQVEDLNRGRLTTEVFRRGSRNKTQTPVQWVHPMDDFCFGSPVWTLRSWGDLDSDPHLDVSDSPFLSNWTPQGGAGCDWRNEELSN